MIKNVVFDAGGVIVSWNPADVLEKFVSDKFKHPALRELVFDSREWREMDAGQHTNAETREILAAKAGALEGEVRALMDGWMSCIPPKEDTLALMRELKERGVGVYILSNWCDTFYEAPQLCAAVEIADGALVSSEEKLAKPDERIYARLCEKFSLNKEECLFTDDMPTNVAAAESCGMRGFLFTSAAALREELVSLGVL